MSRGMRPTKAKLLVISLIWAILLLESEIVSGALQDLVLVQCKHNCKLHNKKECEDRCNEKMMSRMERKTSGQEEEVQDPFCEAFCKSFEGEGLYKRCMTACPGAKFTAEMMAIERQGGGSFDGVAIEDLQTKCNRKCIPNTEPEAHKKCMSGCIISMKIDNEAVCEASCSIIQERPLTIKCIRVCHERIPGAVDSS